MKDIETPLPHIKLLLQQSTASAKTSILVSVIIATIFSFFSVGTELYLWTASIIAISTYRISALVLNNDDTEDEIYLFKQTEKHYWSGLASAAAWGAFSFISLENLPLHSQAFSWVIPMLVAAISMGSYAIILRHYNGFLMVISIVTLSGIMLHNGEESILIVASYLAFGAISYHTASRYNTQLLESSLAQKDAVANADSLEAANKWLAEQQNQVAQEEEIARHVFGQLTLASDNRVYGIHTWNQAMGSLSGDLIQLAKGPKGQTYILLGDFTGHGLPAALGAVPTSTIFKAMSSKGLSVSVIANELNNRLHTLLPTGYFCCAVVMELSANRNSLKIWNGGLPPVIIREASTGRLLHVKADNLPLGVVGDNDFSRTCTEWALKPGDTVYAYSDGVTEAEDMDGEMWGRERLIDFLSDDSRPIPRLEPLKDIIMDFTNLAPASDDISIVEIETDPKAAKHSEAAA